MRGLTKSVKRRKNYVNEANIKKCNLIIFSQSETLTQKIRTTGPHTYKIIQNQQERRINNIYVMLRPVIQHLQQS
jgi:hypothetical protein